MIRGRWYLAVGGEGLEVQREPGEAWHIYGLVKKNRGCWSVILDRQEESFSLGLFQSKQKAMDHLLARSGATLDTTPVESDSAPGATLSGTK